MDNDKDRIVAGSIQSEDLENEITLRPRWLKEYIGQDKTKEKLNIFIQAAKEKRTFRSCVAFWSSWFRETTLANIIANEMGVNIRVTSGPAIERPGFSKHIN